MATTLTSSITEIDVVRLKRALEALGDIRVVSITPPKGVLPTTVVLTKADKVSNLTPAQQSSAQAVIDNHVDLFDESVQEVSQIRAVIGTIESGTVEFVNNGLAWKIGPDKNLVPVGLGRTIGAPGNPVSVIYANTIVGTGGGGGGGSNSTYNEAPIGDIDGINTVFVTANNFVAGSTRVFYNGIRITLGSGKAYTESATNQITLSFAPQSGDELILDYDIAL